VQVHSWPGGQRVPASSRAFLSPNACCICVVTYEKLKQQVYPLGMYWSNWSAEELEYFENAERFPILKDENYTPNWRIQQKFKDGVEIP
jgi:hypothetical protein